MKDRRTVIITGAAGRIGSALAEAYYKADFNVMLADRNIEGGEQIVNSMKQNGRQSAVQLRFVETDLRNPSNIERLISQTHEHFGSIDILINNAGLGHWTSPYDLSVEEWDDVLLTNLRGTFLCSREAAKVMRKQDTGGFIINIASTRAMMSEQHSEAYAASKGGMISLTHALSISLGPDRIKVNAISPGWIESDLYDELREIDHTQRPAGRVGRPDDIVKACFYLTDPQNDFVTGINLVVDGGMTRKMIYVP